MATKRMRALAMSWLDKHKDIDRYTKLERLMVIFWFNKQQAEEIVSDWERHQETEQWAKVKGE